LSGEKPFGASSDPTVALATASAAAPSDLPDYEDVVARIGRQMEAVRAACSLNQGAPYRLALLLRLRLDWAEAFDGVKLQRSKGTGSVELSLDRLENLTPWEPAEAASPLGESVVSLGGAWEDLKLEVARLAPANRHLPTLVAKTLRVPRDLWDQWLSRGRRRLKEHLGHTYVEVFRFWA
jgi:hypothetical protein